MRKHKTYVFTYLISISLYANSMQALVQSLEKLVNKKDDVPALRQPKFVCIGRQKLDEQIHNMISGNERCNEEK